MVRLSRKRKKKIDRFCRWWHPEDKAELVARCKTGGSVNRHFEELITEVAEKLKKERTVRSIVTDHQEVFDALGKE